MDKERKNIFVSHHGPDAIYIDRLKSLISSDLYIYDSSVRESEPNNATKEEYIKYGILSPKITWAGTMIVLIGKDTKGCDYVNWEINFAISQNKRIVGVYLPGCDENDVPELLKKYGDALVSWNRQKIVDAIEDENIWETPQGVPLPIDVIRDDC